MDGPAARLHTAGDHDRPGPSGTVASTRPASRSPPSETGATFQCSLDSAAYARLHLAEGLHGPRRRTPHLQRPRHRRRRERRRHPGHARVDRPAADTTARPTPRSTRVPRAPTAPAPADFRFPPPSRARGSSAASTAARSPTAPPHPPSTWPTAATNSRCAPSTARATRPDPGEPKAWWADALIQNGNFETPITGWATRAAGMRWRRGSRASARSRTVSGGMAGPKAAPRDRDRLRQPRDARLAAADQLRRPGRHLYGAAARCGARRRARRVHEAARVGRRHGGGLGTACVTTTDRGVLHRARVRDPPNGSELDLLAYQPATAAVGDSFDLDGMSLGDGRTGGAAHARGAQGDPVLWPPATWRPAGRAATSPCRGCSTRSRARSRSWATPSRTTATPTSTRAATTPAGAATRRAPGRRWATTSTARRCRRLLRLLRRRRRRARQGLVQLRPRRWHIVVLNSNCDEVGGCGPARAVRVAAAGPARQRGALHRQLLAPPALQLRRGARKPTQGTALLGAPLRAPRGDGCSAATTTTTSASHPDAHGQLDRERASASSWSARRHAALRARAAPQPNTEVQNSGPSAVLELTLHDGSYDWRFVPQDGKSFTDSGRKDCSPLPGPVEPPPTRRSTPGRPARSQSGRPRSASRAAGAASFECSLDTGAFAALLLAQGLLGPGRR